MDGASKFVRGDAIAGIMILVINLVGGVMVGVLQHDMAFGKALSVFASLTIGDGLVAQIPALIISTAAGILVTRVATEDDFSGQVSKQFQANSNALAVVAGVLGIAGCHSRHAALHLHYLCDPVWGARVSRASKDHQTRSGGGDRRQGLQLPVAKSWSGKTCRLWSPSVWSWPIA
jgi:flagellar biosynthesis component FlhA